MRRIGSKFSVFSRALAIANGRSLQTQKFAPLSFQIYEFILCEWYKLITEEFTLLTLGVAALCNAEQTRRGPAFAKSVSAPRARC